MRGNLRNGANAGLFYANLNNGLGNANWNIGARVLLYLKTMEISFVAYFVLLERA